MRKESFLNSLRGLETSPYGVRMSGPDMINSPSTFIKLVKEDHGLEEHKKNKLFTMLNSPEAFDNIMAGAAGSALALAASHFSSLSKPARTLISLAGFGLGNIIYNTVHERKFTKYNPETGISTIVI